MSKTISSLAVACLFALLLAACNGSSYSSPTSPSSPSSPKVVVVQIMDDAFVPKDVQINPGDTVRWIRMSGNMPNHTVTASDGSFDSGAVFPQVGMAFDQTFNTAGATVNYYCRAHQACCMMQGAVQVGSSAPAPRPGY